MVSIMMVGIIIIISYFIGYMMGIAYSNYNSYKRDGFLKWLKEKTYKKVWGEK